MAGTPVTGDDEPGRGSRSADPSQFVGQPRSRLLSQAANPCKEEASLVGFRRTLEPESLCGVRTGFGFEGTGRCSGQRQITGLATEEQKTGVRASDVTPKERIPLPSSPYLPNFRLIDRLQDFASSITLDTAGEFGGSIRERGFPFPIDPILPMSRSIDR